jgi:hypothetical protein
VVLVLVVIHFFTIGTIHNPHTRKVRLYYVPYGPPLRQLFEK